MVLSISVSMGDVSRTHDLSIHPQKESLKPLLIYRILKRTIGSFVSRENRQGLLGDVSAAIFVTMEFQSVLTGDIIDMAVILFRHGVYNLCKDFQVLVF